MIEFFKELCLRKNISFNKIYNGLNNPLLQINRYRSIFEDNFQKLKKVIILINIISIYLVRLNEVRIIYNKNNEYVINKLDVFE